METIASSVPEPGLPPPQSPQRQYFRFVFAAGLSVPVNLASRAIFSTFVRYEVAVLLAHVVGMVTAYTLTRVFVFERSGRSVEVELARFALVNVVSASITWVISVSLVYQVFPRIGWTLAPEFIAHLTGLACSSVFSFLGHRQFSFRRAARDPGLVEPAER